MEGDKPAHSAEAWWIHDAALTVDHARAVLSDEVGPTRPSPQDKIDEAHWSIRQLIGLVERAQALLSRHDA